MENKLPTLYLVDSVMKNLGEEYLKVISKNVVAVFCHAFEKLVCFAGGGCVEYACWGCEIMYSQWVRCVCVCEFEFVSFDEWFNM